MRGAFTATTWRIIAATDITGYGAIATARHPNGNWVISVSLGNRSAAEAVTQAASAVAIDPHGRTTRVSYVGRGVLEINRSGKSV
jgi:hypothetical protein